MHFFVIIIAVAVAVVLAIWVSTTVGHCSLRISHPRSHVLLWQMPSYLPDTRAGSEIMAHRINSFLKERMPLMNIVVAVTKVAPSVRMYENVHVVQWTDELVRSFSPMLVLTQYDVGDRAKGFTRCGVEVLEMIHTPHFAKHFVSWVRRCRDRTSRRLLRVVYNTEWLRTKFPVKSMQSRVLHPPVDFRLYPRADSGDSVLLFNCSKEKGGDTFVAIAKRMPQYTFIGVLGAYGVQIKCLQQPNLQYVDCCSDIRPLLQRARVVVMPSTEESYGMVAVEAMASGVPVVCSDTDGLRESCGEAATIVKDRSDVDEWCRAIDKLFSDQEHHASSSDASLRRAKMLDPLPRLASFADWILSGRCLCDAPDRPDTDCH